MERKKTRCLVLRPPRTLEYTSRSHEEVTLSPSVWTDQCGNTKVRVEESKRVPETRTTVEKRRDNKEERTYLK